MERLFEYIVRRIISSRPGRFIDFNLAENSIVKSIQEDAHALNKFRKIAKQVTPNYPTVLDYPVSLERRYTDNRPHPEIEAILQNGKPGYEKEFDALSANSDLFQDISVSTSMDSSMPNWVNGWFPSLDGMTLMSFIAARKPMKVLEVGSGNSTKYARLAIKRNKLETQLISVDPYPRAEIDGLCDKVHRSPVEEVDILDLEELNEGDILFVDNSHRCFMNSDVTVFFLEHLPRLPKGVLVGIHDVTLPFDYPIDWVDRFYSEQYLLACYLLAKTARFKVKLPLYYLSKTGFASEKLSPLFETLQIKEVPIHGCTFWLETT